MKVEELIDHLEAMCKDNPARLQAIVTFGHGGDSIEGGVFSIDNTVLNLAPLPLDLTEGGF